jgi:hemolysin III
MSDDVILTNKDARKSLKRLEKDIHKNRLLNKRPRVEPPRRVLLEEIGSAVSHGIGAFLSIIGLVFLLIKSTTPLMRVSAIIYMASMFLMCLNSCLYHSWKWGRKVKRIWRRFDYTSIYLQIAGTFAPIQLILLGRVYGQTGQIIGYLYFGLMWAAFITGIVLTCVFGPENVRKVNFPLYFVGGWSALLMVPGWIQYDWHFAMWIFIGGAVYSLGMIPFGLLRRKPGAHFWWHIFVLAGVILHFYAIYQFIFLA